MSNFKKKEKFPRKFKKETFIDQYIVKMLGEQGKHHTEYTKEEIDNTRTPTISIASLCNKEKVESMDTDVQIAVEALDGLKNGRISFVNIK